jgi:hypothetical protein
MAEGPLLCDRHRTPTVLSCVTCGRAICPRCLVHTPAGFKCSTCTGSNTEERRSIGRTVMPLLAALLVVAIPGTLFLHTVHEGQDRGDESGSTLRADDLIARRIVVTAADLPADLGLVEVPSITATNSVPALGSGNSQCEASLARLPSVASAMTGKADAQFSNADGSTQVGETAIVFRTDADADNAMQTYQGPERLRALLESTKACLSDAIGGGGAEGMRVLDVSITPIAYPDLGMEVSAFRTRTVLELNGYRFDCPGDMVNVKKGRQIASFTFGSECAPFPLTVATEIISRVVPRM